MLIRHILLKGTVEQKRERVTRVSSCSEVQGLSIVLHGSSVNPPLAAESINYLGHTLSVEKTTPKLSMPSLMCLRAKYITDVIDIHFSQE